jgi:hypothetical protein
MLFIKFRARKKWHHKSRGQWTFSLSQRAQPQFVCDDQQDTKMLILRYRQCLNFPARVKYKHNGKESYRVISDETIHLIRQLLREKEGRLRSKKYTLNDYTKPATTVNGIDIYIPANKTSKDYQEIYIYADDADESKQHAFFDRVNWNNLHLTK